MYLWSFGGGGLGICAYCCMLNLFYGFVRSTFIMQTQRTRSYVSGSHKEAVQVQCCILHMPAHCRRWYHRTCMVMPMIMGKKSISNQSLIVRQKQLQIQSSA